MHDWKCCEPFAVSFFKLCMIKFCYTYPLSQIVLDSDDTLFGGFNRIDHSAEYFTFVRNIITEFLYCFARAPCIERGF